MNMDFCPNCFEKKDTAGVCPHCGYDASSDERKYPMALRAGNVLGGKYIIGRVLGEGGFGVTYLARDYKEKIPVALKEYFPDSLAARTNGTTLSPFTGDREDAFLYGKECFLEEAKTLSRFIGSKTIVRVYSYFEENNTAYFAMEYIKGKSLLDHLKEQGGKISFEETKRIILPLMDALEAIHREGIVHRDIAPDNIILTEDGGVKLIDFGAARYSLGDRSRSLDVVLKHGYAPMEQYTRRGRQGPYTDVYALCATIYKCLTGRTPPDAVDRMDEDTLIPPSTLSADLPKQAEDALFKGMAIQYRDRYQGVTELREGMFGVEKSNDQSASPQPESVLEYPAEEEEQPNLHQEESFPKRKRKRSLKALLFIGIPVLAVILASVIVIAALTPKAGKNSANTENTVIQYENVDDGVFRIGEKWIVDDQWSFRFNGIYEISERDEESNPKNPDPAKVYMIDYEYENLGIDTENGLEMKFNPYSVDDEEGNSVDPYELSELTGYSEVLNKQREPKGELGKGESYHFYAFFCTDKGGILTYSQWKTTDAEHGAEIHKAKFELDTDLALVKTVSEIRYMVDDDSSLLQIGKTWTVDDQWSLTLNSITTTQERSPTTSLPYEVAQVYLVDYTYTNINYDNDNGFVCFLQSGARDFAGIKCEYYFLPDTNRPKLLKPGESITCQDTIAVSQSGGFIVEDYAYTDDAHGARKCYYGFTYKNGEIIVDVTEQENNDAITYTETDFGDFTVQLPSNWTYEVENGGIYFYESYVHAQKDASTTGYLCDIVGIDPQDADTLRPNARQLGQAGSLEYYVQFPMGIGVIEDETAKEKMQIAYDQVETFVQSVIMK